MKGVPHASDASLLEEFVMGMVSGAEGEMGMRIARRRGARLRHRLKHSWLCK